MNKYMKHLMSFLMTLAMVLGLFSTTASASGNLVFEHPGELHVYTEAENAVLENDVFSKISGITENAAQAMGGISQMTEADYINLVPQVIEAIEGSETYVPGTLQQNGNFLIWETTTGIPCCYDPRMEAELHSDAGSPTEGEIMAVEEEANLMAASLQDTLAELNGGSAASVEIGLIQPYWESSSSYADSSFRNYSPYYKSMWQSLYQATGGSSNYRYSMSNATIDNIAKAIQNCGLVIFDSHGTTDYSGSNEDYTSRANSSYLCLTSNSGITSTDTAAKTGTYGTYYDALKGSGYAYVNGQCIANHMTSNAPNSLVYMGICLGMATDKMFTGLRAKGVETVYGYSQSVSFVGERQYMQSILGYVKNGDTFASALSKTKSSLGSWDPAYSSYSLSQAKSNKVAFPIAVSSEDTYPGQGNVDAVQTVNSTWQLFGEATSYTVTAQSNNTSYGTVSVNGTTITASPKTGYYVSGYQVVSGSATVTQNGNTFTVTPSSDCTVQINFAQKTSYTVTYKALGSTVSTATVYSGEAVTLPASATSFEGWTFMGWAENTVAETTVKPTVYAGGASYTPAGNVTLYAVYKKTTGTGGENVYELVTSAPSDWSGNYVITYGNTTGSLYALKGLSGNTRYESTSAGGATAYSSTGMTLSDNKLSDVSQAYIFNMASYNGKYSLKNASTGTYLGSYNSYLYSRSSLSSSYCAWTPAISGSTGTLSNTASSRYPYLAFSGSKYFMVNSSTSGIYFWKETAGGTTTYTTSPSNETETHEHTFGSWVSNNNGTHSHVCAECGTTETENCTYTDVVTAPTATSQGYTTHTCSVCGYSYTDSFTPALGTDYVISFSVPSGVASVASVTCNSNSSITLPTAGAPSGYTFLGWVVSDVNNSEVKPSSILTGTYKPTASVTLKALYTYTEGNGSVGYELVTSAPSDWSGKYVITYGNTTGSLYALKGLSGNTRYESTSAGGSIAYASTGMTLSGNTLTNVSDAYVFDIASYNSKYSIKNVSTGTYLASRSSYLYSYKSLSSSYCRWTLSMNGSAVKAQNTASSRYPYLSFSSSKYFMVNSSASSGIYFWKQTSVGSTYYTTIIQ